MIVTYALNYTNIPIIARKTNRSEKELLTMYKMAMADQALILFNVNVINWRGYEEVRLPRT